MTKNLLLFFFLIATPLLFAQDIDRIQISGEIHVPKGEDAEGISIYNLSSQKGTITEADGSFKIDVAENDRLQIYALQYQSFTVVVDKGVVEQRKMNIYLNPAITQLEEVVVRPYDLSGNIKADVEKIPTYSIAKDWDLSYKAMEFEYGFEQDEQSAIQGNAAEEALNQNNLRYGLNVLNVMGGVGNLLFPGGKEISSREQVKEDQLVSNNVQQRFSREFIRENFGIPTNKAFDFLFFAQENGLDRDLLKPENEIKLMDFLREKSREYKKLQKK